MSIARRKAEIVRADTVFQVREALLDAEQMQKKVVILTKLHETELGHDVRARLARSKLFPINHWASLCSLFKAKELDRSVCNADLAQALLESAPPDGYPPVSAGILDAGDALGLGDKYIASLITAQEKITGVTIVPKDGK